MDSAAAGPRWELAKHVRACECDGNVILLDLNSSRYLGIGVPESQLIAHHVANWPVSNSISAYAIHGASAADAVVHRLHLQGLLADASAAPNLGATTEALNGEIAGDQAIPVAEGAASHLLWPPAVGLEEATATLVLDRAPVRAGSAVERLMAALRFTHSVAAASVGLRCRSLMAITRSVSTRRAGLLGPRGESLEAMTPAVAEYERLRPFLFTARAQCLLDSLALVGYLARVGFAPRWVVGVRTGPFGAHSWVQSGNTVLNDQHEYVRQFRPILVV